MSELKDYLRHADEAREAHERSMRNSMLHSPGFNNHLQEVVRREVESSNEGTQNGHLGGIFLVLSLSALYVGAYIHNSAEAWNHHEDTGQVVSSASESGRITVQAFLMQDGTDRALSLDVGGKYYKRIGNVPPQATGIDRVEYYKNTEGDLVVKVQFDDGSLSTFIFDGEGLREGRQPWKKLNL